MKDSCSIFVELLEKYFDQEATDEERSLVETHLQGCPDCLDRLTWMEGLRSLIKTPVDEADAREDFYGVWRKIEQGILPRERNVWKEALWRWFDPAFLLRKRVWIPAAAAVCILLLALTPLLYKKGPFPSDLSVVEYVESPTNNVMVYELEKGNVTVIWLFESQSKEGTSTS